MAFALHTANLDSVPDIPYGPPSTIRNNSLSAEPEVTLKHCWVWPGKKKKQYLNQS